jgi:hypothetical protein
LNPGVGVGKVERLAIVVRHPVDRRGRRGLATTELVEPEVDADPEQPGAEPSRRVEPIEPIVNFPERLLRQVAGQFFVVNQPRQDADQFPLVAEDQRGEGLVVAGAGTFDQAGLAPFAGRRFGHRRGWWFRGRMREGATDRPIGWGFGLT